MGNNQLELAYDEIKSKHFNKIHALTKPLGEFFPIPYFSYQKVYTDGHYTFTANRPDFSEYYLEKQFYSYDPFLISPHAYSDGRIINVISEEFNTFDSATQATLDEIERKFSFYESILILIKNFDYYEIFVFSIAVKGRKGIQLFFNNYDLIERFINYFKHNMQDELDDIHDMGINLSNLRGDNFRDTSIYPHQNESISMRDEFIKCVSPEEYRLSKNLKTLTPRELECLYWIVNGKTADETAKILNISRRTVECFREKCRVKLGSHYSFSNLIYKIGKYKLLS